MYCLSCYSINPCQTIEYFYSKTDIWLIIRTMERKNLFWFREIKKKISEAFYSNKLQLVVIGSDKIKVYAITFSRDQTRSIDLNLTPQNLQTGFIFSVNKILLNIFLF